MGRILEEAAKSRLRKEDWIRNLSRHVAMCPRPILLFVQVYFPLAGLIYSKSESMMISSTHSLARSQTGEPPFFSEEVSLMLRLSTIIIFSGLCKFRKDFKES
jgi:hypothetical protein